MVRKISIFDMRQYSKSYKKGTVSNRSNIKSYMISMMVVDDPSQSIKEVALRLSILIHNDYRATFDVVNKKLKEHGIFYIVKDSIGNFKKYWWEPGTNSINYDIFVKTFYDPMNVFNTIEGGDINGKTKI